VARQAASREIINEINNDSDSDNDSDIILKNLINDSDSDITIIN